MQPWIAVVVANVVTTNLLPTFLTWTITLWPPTTFNHTLQWISSQVQSLYKIVQVETEMPQTLKTISPRYQIIITDYNPIHFVKFS